LCHFVHAGTLRVRGGTASAERAGHVRCSTNSA
jgi:hypothetical protein